VSLSNHVTFIALLTGHATLANLKWYKITTTWSKFNSSISQIIWILILFIWNLVTLELWLSDCCKLRRVGETY
jgi:hypothetical protein